MVLDNPLKVKVLTLYNQINNLVRPFSSSGFIFDTYQRMREKWAS